VISSLIDNPSHSSQVTSPDGLWIYDNVVHTDSSTLLDYGGILFTSNNFEYNIFNQNGQYFLETVNPQGTLYSGRGWLIHDHGQSAQSSDHRDGDRRSRAWRSARASISRSATPARPQPPSRIRASAKDHALSLNVSSHFAAPAAGDALSFSATLPTGLHIDAHTGIISGNADQRRCRQQSDQRDGDRLPWFIGRRDLQSCGQRQQSHILYRCP